MSLRSFTALLFLCTRTFAWIGPPARSRESFVRLLASAGQSDLLDARISKTDRGRSASKGQRDELQKLFEEIEGQCTLKAPARSPLVEGDWVVEYTDAPAPSNGQLGPFAGIAYQTVDLTTGRYANILRVPPNDWLSATLEATWEEWDGVLLEDDRAPTAAINAVAKSTTEASNPVQNALSSVFGQGSTPSATADYGGSSWSVTFESLTIKLFGIPLVSKKFENTKRIWRTTYVDETTRIVRAGRTGVQKDEMLFYMTRSDQ